MAAAVKLSDRYITDRFLPDKAIDLLDEAGSRARIDAMTRPPEVKTSRSKSKRSGGQKGKDHQNRVFRGAANMRDRKSGPRKNEKIMTDWRTSRKKSAWWLAATTS